MTIRNYVIIPGDLALVRWPVMLAHNVAKFTVEQNTGTVTERDLCLVIAVCETHFGLRCFVISSRTHAIGWIHADSLLVQERI